MRQRFVRKIGLCASILFLMVAFLSGSALAQVKYGTQVAKNLYHVHTRVLWDLGWLTEAGFLTLGHFTYNDVPKNLVYANARTLFLSPLEGYGVPEKPMSAYRKVRLYVSYGHQMGAGGTPTVRIVSGNGEVEFSLPVIGGAFGDVAANWSDFKDLSEYEGIGHANIQVYQKDASSTGGNMGAVYRIEAHFYDGYGKNWAP